MRPIRASEISSFLYCKRAWWYQNQGIESANIEELAEGNELHHQHGRVVVASSVLRMLAYGLLLAAVVAFAAYVTNLFL
jgi:CRISPR/Cas system-associated exonuclease Cas4 (RecB family)